MRCSKTFNLLEPPATSRYLAQHNSAASCTEIDGETSGFIGFKPICGSHTVLHLSHLSAAIIAEHNIKKQIDALLKYS
jgi:hypothetical protein